MVKSIAAKAPTITQILERLGGQAGSRERLILLDLDATSRNDADYPGCRIITSKVHGQMIYHVANNTIVG